MIGDTILAIKDAEAKAAKLLADADAECVSIEAQAKEDAAKDKNDRLEAAKADADKKMDELVSASEGEKKQFEEELTKEIEAMRALAATRKESAIQSVMEAVLPD